MSSIIPGPEFAAAFPTVARNEYLPTDGAGEPGPNLPPWIDARELLAKPMRPPPEIIRGILHQGCKLVLGGASKARKSWLLLDLGFSTAHGADWLIYGTQRVRTLYVNFELHDWAVHHRLTAISRARELPLPDAGMLCLWNLRGHSAPYGTLLPMLSDRARGQGFGLVILDPSYKLLGTADENSARDISQLMNGLETLTQDIGASLAFSSHFSKGNQSGKESIDRISGSGVFSRDPDSILTLTELKIPDAYALEAKLRNLPPQPSYAVEWKYPLMRTAPELDPAELKQAKTGRPAKDYTLEMLELIKDTTQAEPITTTAWSKAMKWSRPTLCGRLEPLRNQGLIATVGEGQKARKFITEKGRKFLDEQLS